MTTGTIAGDDYLPVLIYVVLKADVTQMMSQLEFISCFANPTCLNGEMGYQFSSLQAAVQWLVAMADGALASVSSKEDDIPLLSPEIRQFGSSFPTLAS